MSGIKILIAGVVLIVIHFGQAVAGWGGRSPKWPHLSGKQNREFSVRKCEGLGITIEAVGGALRSPHSRSAKAIAMMPTPAFAGNCFTRYCASAVSGQNSCSTTACGTRP
jgi:hypothetical protein